MTDKSPLPEGSQKTIAVRKMFDTIAPRYEFVNRIMTLGMDRRWRERTVRDLRLPLGSVVVDVAAGTGDFSRELIRQGHRAVSTDLSFGMLSAGHAMPLRVQADASQLPFHSESFEGATCGYALRNFTDLEGTLREIARVLRPGGRISFLEVAEPSSGLWRWGFQVWFRRLVPLIGSLFSDRDAYHYLPRSTAYLPPTPELVALFQRAGFSGVNHRVIMGGLSQQIIATKALSCWNA